MHNFFFTVFFFIKVKIFFMKLRYSQKTENKLKVCPESMYIPQKVSEVTIPITNKYGKLKV